MNILYKKLKLIFISQSGMTLVEILVAMGIMAIMLTATITYLPQYRANQQLRQASLDLMNGLRKAQTLALSPDDAEADGYIWIQDKERKYCGQYFSNNRVMAVVPFKKGFDGMPDPNSLTNEVVAKPLSKDKCISYDNFYADSKIKIVGNNLPTYYFEAKTGRIYTDKNLSTIDSAGGREIKFAHVTTEKGGLAYIIKVSNSNFQLNRGKL